MKKRGIKGNVIEDVKCANCSHKFAELIIEEKGKSSLRVLEKTQILILDKPNNVGALVCPVCNSLTLIDLRVWENN
jgi:hypothetical protein